MSQTEHVPPFGGLPRAWSLTRLLLPAGLLALLVGASSLNYLVFHTLAELAAIFVGVMSFVVAFYTHPFVRNAYLTYLGCGFLGVAGLDLLHAFSYEGLDLLPFGGANRATQFWLAARFLQAGVLLTAPWFLGRRVCVPLTLSIVLFVAGAGAGLVALGRFPDAYVPGQGLTAFKIGSEYLIVALLVAAGFYTWQRRAALEPRILSAVLFSLVLTICAELAFTLYRGPYDWPNLVGHLLKFAAFGLVFAAVVRTTLTRPFQVMAREATTYDAVPDAIAVVDRGGIVRQLNGPAQELTGQSESRLVGGDCHRAFHAADVAPEACPVCTAIAAGRPLRALELERPDGSWLEISLSPITDGGEVRGMVHVARLVTARKQAEFEMRRLSRAIAQSEDLVMITDRAGVIEYVNPAFERITGYRRDEVTGRQPSVLRSGSQKREFYTRLWDTILSGVAFRDVFVNRRRDGSFYYEEKTITPLRDEQGRIASFVSTGKDITDRMEAQEKLRHLAHHDALTGLPNRTLLRDRLEHCLAGSGRRGNQLAVLFMDLDRFKTINDSLGHSVGDVFLKAAAKRLAGVVRAGDTLARHGGDEFVIVMEPLRRPADAAAVAEKVLQVMSEPFDLGGYEVFVTASLGIAVAPEDGLSFDDLLKHADAAMYRAKQAGGDTYQFYTQDMNADTLERLDVRVRLRHALDRGEFSLQYQPRIDLDTGRVVGAEALLRWDNPELGSVSPEAFVPALEESGLINVVGRWVLETACAQLVRWDRAGLPALRLSVNLSARQLRQPGFVEEVREVLGRTGVDPRAIELELTERMLVDNVEATIALLHDLHRLGLSISVDDFGTGYSSLSYLKRFPIDYVKIDRSFVEGIPQDGDDVAIATAIIAMAGNLRLRATAEGIETPAQYTYLREHRCTEGQGFLFGRPMAAERFERWLRQNRGVWSERAGIAAS